VQIALRSVGANGPTPAWSFHHDAMAGHHVQEIDGFAKGSLKFEKRN
jgi:hypothetical protein